MSYMIVVVGLVACLCASGQVGARFEDETLEYDHYLLWEKANYISQYDAIDKLLHKNVPNSDDVEENLNKLIEIRKKIKNNIFARIGSTSFGYALTQIVNLNHKVLAKKCDRETLALLKFNDRGTAGRARYRDPDRARPRRIDRIVNKLATECSTLCFDKALEQFLGQVQGLIKQDRENIDAIRESAIEVSREYSPAYPGAGSEPGDTEILHLVEMEDGKPLQLIKGVFSENVREIVRMMLSKYLENEQGNGQFPDSQFDRLRKKHLTMPCLGFTLFFEDRYNMVRLFHSWTKSTNTANMEYWRYKASFELCRTIVEAEKIVFK